MKSKKLKSKLCGLILFMAFTAVAQEDTISNRFLFHSVSLSPIGIFYAEIGGYNDDSLFVGPSFSGQANFNYKKNLFGISGAVGSNVDIIWSDGVDDWFYEFDLLYGREFKLSKRIYISVFTGVGVLNKQFDESVRDNGIESSTSFAVPLQVEFNPLISGNFAIGFQIQTTISNQKPLFTGGLLLQYYRKPKF